jgi:branched-chain amino acid transport system permease protein
MANAFVAAFEILSFGAIIVLIVLGLGIIASMMGIFNFAQGEFVLLGAYITYLAYARGLPIWAASTPRRSWRCSAPMRWA